MLGRMEEIGRLGNGATTDQSSPVDVHTSSDNSDALSDIASVSAGGEFTPVRSPWTARLNAGEMEIILEDWAMGQRIVAPIPWMLWERESGHYRHLKFIKPPIFASQQLRVGVYGGAGLWIKASIPSPRFVF